jgi:hypothetical protein
MNTDPAVIGWGRRALVLVLVGLLVQLGATFYWSPATFILSAVIGLPSVVVGAALFAWAVLRDRIRDRGRQ